MEIKKQKLLGERFVVKGFVAYINLHYGKFGKHALKWLFGKREDRLEKFMMNKYKITSLWEAIDM